MLVDGYILARGRSYSVQSQIMPEARTRQPTATAGIAGLAAEFGVTVGGGAGGGSSPALLEDLLGSRTLLVRAVQSTYRVDSAGNAAGPQELLSIFRIDTARSKDAVGEAVLKLQGMITTRSDAKTGVLTLRVVAESPGVALAISRPAD